MLISSLQTQAMKVDISIKRVAAFAKRLLQVALQSPAPFAAGILFLVSEVLKVWQLMHTFRQCAVVANLQRRVLCCLANSAAEWGASSPFSLLTCM
jgi:CBF/Mak21 family